MGRADLVKRIFLWVFETAVGHQPGGLCTGWSWRRAWDQGGRSGNKNGNEFRKQCPSSGVSI